MMLVYIIKKVYKLIKSLHPHTEEFSFKSFSRVKLCLNQPQNILATTYFNTG